MKKYIIITILITLSCKGHIDKNEAIQELTSKTISNSEFELIKAENQKGLLILFPCFPCSAKNTLREFDIVEKSIQNGFSVLAMNLNERLYLKPEEKQELAERLIKIISEYELSQTNIFIGGFSSGGNVSLLITDYLIKNKLKIQPKGVFVVDSPVDLLGLYKTAVKNLKLNYSKPSVQESTWIKLLLDNEFGNPKNGINNYELYAPFTLETQNIENLRGLKNVKIRFYTEPDLKWWAENANNEYEDLNAYYIEKLSEKLKTEFGKDKIELIKTENKGYRSNGERHPHSWSIVNEKDLINWMKL